MAAARDENFDPLTPVAPSRTEDEAIKLANVNEYGVAAGVYDPDTKMSREVDNQI